MIILKLKSIILGILLSIGSLFFVHQIFAVVDVSEVSDKGPEMGLSLVDINSIIGTIRGIFNDNGKIGIGTSSPLAQLEVDGNIIADLPIAGNHVATRDYVDLVVGSSSGVSMISSLIFPTEMNYSSAVYYCRNFSGSAEFAMNNDVLTVYSDWRLPTLEEIAVFSGLLPDTDPLWTSSTYENTAQGIIYFTYYAAGSWGISNITRDVRCVR